MQLRKRIEQLVSRHGRLAPKILKNRAHLGISASHPLNCTFFSFAYSPNKTFTFTFHRQAGSGNMFFQVTLQSNNIPPVEKRNIIFTITLGLWWFQGTHIASETLLTLHSFAASHGCTITDQEPPALVETMAIAGKASRISYTKLKQFTYWWSRSDYI